MTGATAKRKQYRLSDGKWSIDWEGFQSIICRRMNATSNLAALQGGKKAVSGGIALFGRELEEIDIDFDGIRAQSQKSSESYIKGIEQTCDSRQQTGESMQMLVCVECASAFIHAEKFKQGLNATSQKNLATIRAADANWDTAVKATRTIRDLSVDAFFSLGAIVVPAPMAWKAGHIALKAAITCSDNGAAKAGTGLAANIVLSLVPKQGKLVAEIFVNSAKETADDVIDGKPLAEAVINSLMTNVADATVKSVINTGELRAWLSKKAIPVRIQRSGPMDMISKSNRKELIDKTGELTGKAVSKFGTVAVKSVDMTNGNTSKGGEASLSVKPEQFRSIAQSIVASVA